MKGLVLVLALAIAVLSCQRSPSVYYGRSATPAPTVSANRAEEPPIWWCTTVIDGEVGWCGRDKLDCLALSAPNDRGVTWSVCAPQMQASCFRRAGYGAYGDQVKAECAPTLATCEALRAGVARDGKYPPLGNCWWI